MATIRYPLASTTFTETECDKLEVILYKTILPKMGVNRHIGKVYRYGPISSQGLACPNIYTEQGIAQLQLLLDHGGLTTQCGILLPACYESSTLETGSAYPMFDLPYANYQSLTTQSYLKSIW
jgi:hypothetical protein